ncbi:85/88 kDa calcium-independent phospholipase A2 [Aphelenchoides besseyi]|nr:85/88 kDa calcium-independent phospholipase A2 [Aphelenchoides besseyi]KAI6223374.1 85/88 kDa calcium-independent phospholipase A2 [Aphelenchoides besseyi]
MTDSDSESFHSCDDGETLEDRTLELQIRDSKRYEKPAATKVQEKSELTSVQSTVQQEKKTDGNEKKTSEEGWDRFGDDEADSSGSASDNEADDPANGDWDSWGDEEQTDKRPKVHRLKHHTTKRDVGPEDIPSDSTEADDRNEHKNRSRVKNQVKHEPQKPDSQSLWEWTGLNEVVNAVGGTLSNVVESGLGLPNAEEMAAMSVAQRRKILEEAQHVKEPEPSLSSDEATEPQSPSPSEQQIGSGFGGLFSGIVTGGLDVLETLGKKTFETLTVKDEADNDRRRFLLTVSDNRQNLSDVLREVRTNQQQQQAGESTADRSAGGATARRMRLGYGSANIEKINTNFINLFERAEGMVNLEGLELLSTGCKERNLLKKINPAFDDELAEFCVEDVSECTTEDFVYELKKCINGVGLPYKADNVLKMDAELCSQLEHKQQQVDNGKEIVVEEMHEAAIVALAQLTAHSIQALHKIAQLIVIANDQPDLESLFAFTFVLCRRLSFYASQYANLLSLVEASKLDDVVTNIFFECSNACHYIKKALTLLRPFFTV